MVRVAHRFITSSSAKDCRENSALVKFGFMCKRRYLSIVALFILASFSLLMVAQATQSGSSQQEARAAKSEAANPGNSNTLEIVKIVAAGIAFCVGLCQYRAAQRWKRVEFVAAEMKLFFEDEAVKAALAMLDWSQREIALHRHRDPNDHKTDWVTYEITASALNTDPDATYDPIQTPIREIFDAFLAHLERFESFVQAKVVKESDLDPYLHYWTRLLSGNDEKSPLVRQRLLPQLWTFVSHFRYTKVVKFVSRYHELTPELKTKARA